MPYYECVYLARQDIASSQVEALSDSFAETIANGGGEVKKREYWGLRNLAYRVKKNRKAHYVLMNIDAPAAAVHEMQRLMRLNADVLRELTLRVDELNEGPSIMMQRREERRDRGERRSRRDEERRSEKAAAERAAGKAAEKAEHKPAEGKAAEDKPAENKPAGDKSTEGKPAEKTAGEGSKPDPADAREAAEKAPSEPAAKEAAAADSEDSANDAAGKAAGGAAADAAADAAAGAAEKKEGDS